MVEAPIHFAKTKDGGFKPCVDYPRINLVTVKNRYLIRLISKMINWVGEATVFTKLDPCSTYNLIQIEEGDEYKEW